MSVVLNHEGTDITSYVVEYQRSQSICTGIGTLEVTLLGTYSTTIETWEEFELVEEGNSVGIYYVTLVNNDQPTGTIKVTCQDGSKRLTDYFVSDNILIDYYSLTSHWIDTFLTQAGVTHTIAGDGVEISNNTTLGLASCYDQVVMLMQMSGWYMRFEGTTCIIGDLATNYAPVETITDVDIIKIVLTKNDKQLRNRALAIGGTNPYTEKQVSAERSTITPYNYDSNDFRTAVMMNGAMWKQEDADRIATQMLTTFANITLEKQITIKGARSYKIGDFISVQTVGVWSGSGRITSLGSSMNSAGLITNVVLDEKCPRLFTCFNPYPILPWPSGWGGGDYVYASTTQGVYRKPIDVLDGVQVWENYSTGLPSGISITDLYKGGGVLSAVTVAGEAYVRPDGYSTWRKVVSPNLHYTVSGYGELIPYSGSYSAHAVTQDRITNSVRLAVDNRPSGQAWDYPHWGSGLGFSPYEPGNKAWVLDINPTSATMVKEYPINISGCINMMVLDIENDGMNDYVSVVALNSTNVSSGYIDPFAEKGFGSTVNLFGIETGGEFYLPSGFLDVDYSYVYSYKERFVTFVQDDPYAKEFASYTVRPTVETFKITRIATDSSVYNFTMEPAHTYPNIPLGLNKESDTIYTYYYLIPSDHPTFSVHRVTLDVTSSSVTEDISIFESVTATDIYESNPYPVGFDTYFPVWIGDMVYFGKIIQATELAPGLIETDPDPYDFNYNFETFSLNIRTGAINSQFYNLTHHNVSTDASLPRVMIKRTATGPIYIVTWLEIYKYDRSNYWGAHQFDAYIWINGVEHLVGSSESPSFSNAIGQPELLYDCQFTINDSLVTTRFSHTVSGVTTYFYIEVTNGGISYETEFSDTDLHNYIMSQYGLTMDIYGGYYGPMGAPLNISGATRLLIADNNSTFYLYDIDRKTEFLVDELDYVNGIFPNQDFKDGTVYVNGGGTIDGISYNNAIFGIDLNSRAVTKVLTGTTELFSGDTFGTNHLNNFGHFFWSKDLVIYPDVMFESHIIFGRILVLRRDSNDFAIVHESSAIDRLDISGTQPLVTMGVGLSDTWILPNSPALPTLSGVIPIINNDLPLGLVNDFRTASRTGMMNKSLIFSTSSGIFTVDIASTPGWSYIPAIPSYISNYYHLGNVATNLDPSGIMVGNVGQIETTNSKYPGQFVFATISGLFYQASPDGAWSERSVGLPSGIDITRIRVDERI